MRVYGLPANRAGTCAALGFALLVVYGGAVGCGRTSKSPDGAMSAGASSGDAGQFAEDGGSGGRNEAGRGGVASNTEGGSLAVGFGGSEPGVTPGGAGGTSGGVSGSTGGVVPVLGGGAGEHSGSAGEGGAGATCRDLCTEDAPACCAAELRCLSHVSRCRIDVLAGMVSRAYEYEALEQAIATSSGEVVLSISDADVIWAAVEPPSAARFELHLGPEATAAGAAIASGFNQPFRVSCDDRTLFVGVIYPEGGAAALRVPVLHVAGLENGPLVLRLGGWQGAWLGLEFLGSQLSRERIDRPELRGALCARGILSELDPL